MFIMKMSTIFIPMLFLITLFGALNLYPCSTFMLKSANKFIIGHNLDMSFDIPGMIVVNKRNMSKTGISWFELISNTKPSTPSMTWTSKYGSITFNPLGKEFPDGGINEAGLYIQEMTLQNTVFPKEETLPKMFMMQWMQYQLDNYSTVNQVIKHISEINLDGWGWHFFVCDKSGAYAVVEFIEGTIKIYKDPIPVLCNGPYPEELQSLEAYESFGGDKKVDLAAKDTPRFAYAATMLKTYDPASKIVDYGFDILEGLDRGTTKWSYVIDIENNTIYFRTSIGAKIKYFNYHDFDFSCDTPAKVIDINLASAGNVTDQFNFYSAELNHNYVKLGIESVNKGGGMTQMVESQNNTLEQLISSMFHYPESVDCQKNE
jgi:choloylglycine hydrolase